MRYSIQSTPEGKFHIMRDLFPHPLCTHDSYEAAKANLDWVLHEERIQRRADRAYDDYVRRYGDED